MCEVSRTCVDRIQENLFGWNFFDDGFARRMISAGPLPCLAEPESAIWKNLGDRSANAGHQLAFAIDVLISHVQ